VRTEHYKREHRRRRTQFDEEKRDQQNDSGYAG